MERVYIQVAYQINDPDTHLRELGNPLKIDDNHKKIVVTMDDYIEGSFQGVEHVHLKDFLHSAIVP